MKRVVLTALTILLGCLFASSLTTVGVVFGAPLIALGALSGFDLSRRRSNREQRRRGTAESRTGISQ